MLGSLGLPTWGGHRVQAEVKPLFRCPVHAICVAKPSRSSASADRFQLAYLWVSQIRKPRPSRLCFGSWRVGAAQQATAEHGSLIAGPWSDGIGTLICVASQDPSRGPNETPEMSLSLAGVVRSGQRVPAVGVRPGSPLRWPCNPPRRRRQWLIWMLACDPWA